ncbi:hypothetical protein QR680_006477 [Steinernema hermaphroditum]|uniref:Uncharacterized protein n=1 Tax=Steinernema hermaphroditum TaxID=289476 RepID=A0AA39HXZ5_9BILA|nr:hypothetical protein QR680_006477 [Steinernema hermaphroditum]
MLFAAFFPIFKCILLAFLFQIGAIVDTFDLTTELYTIGIFFRFLSSLWTSSAKATRSARRLLAQAHMRSSVSGIAKLTISYTKRYEGWQHCAVNMSSSSYFRALVEKAKEEHVFEGEDLLLQRHILNQFPEAEAQPTTILRSVWLLWIPPALSAVASGALPKRYEDEHCDLKLFPSSYFHAVTCRGIARVAMKVTDVDTMNKKIDTLLEKAKEEHKEKQCLKEKTFYYNATSLIFLKYDLDGGDVAY